MKHTFTILIVILTLVFPLYGAHELPFPDLQDQEVKVALVLSGGGARGFAHIPIIQALEDASIPIDMVVGTSMGALIGGFYAAGYSPSEMIETLESYDMIELFAVSPVSYQSPELSVFADYKNNILTLEFDEGGLGRAPGLIGDQNILEMLNNSLIKISGITDFDDLPIPFRAVGTDLVSGEKIIFSRGSLISAIRASISIPGVFAPAILDDRVIVDGGLVDNLPIEIAKDMGADIIIAVDVNAGDYLTEKEDLDTLSSVFGQLVVILMKNTIVDQLDEAHLLISPLVNAYGILDFTSYKDILRIGEQTAEATRDKIGELSEYLCSLKNCTVSDTLSRTTYAGLPDIRIDSISHTIVNPDEQVPEIFPSELFSRYEGTVLDIPMLSKLQKQLDELRYSNRYATVTYRIEKVAVDREGNPHGNLDIVTRDFEPRHVTLSLGLFGSSLFRIPSSGNPVFTFDPDFSVKLEAREFFLPSLTFDLSIVQQEAIVITPSLIYHFSPWFSIGSEHEYQRGSLHGAGIVTPGANDGEDYSYTPSLSAYVTYENSAIVKLSASFTSLWYQKSDLTYDYRFVPTLSFGGVYTTQNYSLFPRQGRRLDFDFHLAMASNQVGFKAELRGSQTWALGDADFLTLRGNGGITYSVAHRKEDYFLYGGYDGIVTLSPVLRVRERVVTSLTYTHIPSLKRIPLLFGAKLTWGIRGPSTDEIYASTLFPPSGTLDFFTDTDTDLALSAGLGLKIQNADILFAVALDMNLNTAFVIEVR